jgi:hypothetical protein
MPVFCSASFIPSTILRLGPEEGSQDKVVTQFMTLPQPERRTTSASNAQRAPNLVAIYALYIK